MREAVRVRLRSILLGAGIAALLALSFAGEFIWWRVVISDPLTYSAVPFLIPVHLFAAISVILLVLYLRRCRAGARSPAGPALSALGFDMKIATFPVRVHWLFVVVILILTMRSLSFAAFAAIGVLIHELGHAFAASRLHQTDIQIVLHSV